jgi:hypothetical protein
MKVAPFTVFAPLFAQCPDPNLMSTIGSELGQEVPVTNSTLSFDEGVEWFYMLKTMTLKITMTQDTFVGDDVEQREDVQEDKEIIFNPVPKLPSNRACPLIYRDENSEFVGDALSFITEDDNRPLLYIATNLGLPDFNGSPATTQNWAGPYLTTHDYDYSFTATGGEFSTEWRETSISVTTTNDITGTEFEFFVKLIKPDGGGDGITLDSAEIVSSEWYGV